MVYLDSGKLILPSRLALNYGNVTHAGKMSEITDALQKVCELDLSNNNITEWTEVHFHLRSSHHRMLCRDIY